MSADRVAIDVEDHIADVRLVRADKHNALDGEMFLAIRDAAVRMRDEPDVAGMASGPLDANALLDREDGEIANLAQAVSHYWQVVPVPVIAALHGACFGGGLQIAVGADIRIAAPDARLSVMEIRWGLVPDMAITQALPKLVGIDVAKELTFTGRIVDGTEAARLGLVTRVADDPYAAARELAAEIAQRSPDAIRSAKRLYNESWQAPAADGLLLESELQRALIGSPNQIEAVRAGFAKETPDFADPEGAATPAPS
jgi:enoyl-CoA hydratase/carnithine racemase